jgi:hypothetical protein
VAVGVLLRPPAPVTETVHGVRAEPVYVTGSVHVTVVVDVALVIENVVELDELVWLLSPVKLYDAVAVPTSVFDEYVAVGAELSPPAPVTETVQGV